jgi:hypothetical protein
MLTPQDRETIERARYVANAFLDGDVVKEVFDSLLAILDRLAAEDDADNDLPEYLDRTDNPVDMGPGMLPRKLAAPSSPLPAAICARCGKQYDEHYLNAKFCTDHNENWDIFLPAPDKPEQGKWRLEAGHDWNSREMAILNILRSAIAASEARIMEKIKNHSHYNTGELI